jgi:hypothetical protein
MAALPKRPIVIHNLYENLPEQYKSSGPKTLQLMPGILEHPYRAGIIGASGSMKTCLFVNILILSGVFNRRSMFSKVIYVCPTADDQPLIREAVDNQYDRLITITNLEELPEIDDYEDDGPCLVCFDDLLSANKKDTQKIERWFLKSRIKNCSLIYISQSYYGISKTIRQQLTNIMLKNLSSLKDLALIMSDFNDKTDINYLKRCYRYCMKQNGTGFLFIDLRSSVDKFRCGFDRPFPPPPSALDE